MKELSEFQHTAPAVRHAQTGNRPGQGCPSWLVGAALAMALAGSATLPPMSQGVGPRIAFAQSKEAKLAAERLAVPMAPITAAQPAGKILLPEGTRIKLVILDELRSNKLSKGEIVHYALREDLRGPNGEVLVPKGTPATGVINESRGARSMGRKGKLEFTADSLNTATDLKIPLRSTQVADGKSKTGTVVAVSLLLSPLGLFMKGKNITIDRGEVIEAYINAPTTLDKAAFENMTRQDVDSIAKDRPVAK